MKNIKILLSITLLILLISSCDKNNDPMPSTLDDNTVTSIKNTPIFSPMEVKVYASNNSASKTVMYISYSTDSSNFTHLGSGNGALRTKTSSCAEPSSGLKLPANQKGKIYLKVISKTNISTTQQPNYINTTTHIATLNIKEDKTMSLINYPQVDGHKTTMSNCGVDNYHITIHYPDSYYNE